MVNSAEDLNIFAEKLIEEKGLTYLPDDVGKQLRLDLMQRLENQINATVLEHMPPDKLIEFEKQIDSGDEKAIQDFASQNIPDLAAKISATLIRFRTTYLS